MKHEIEEYTFDQEELTVPLADLEILSLLIEETLAAPSLEPAPLCDPLTGRVLNELPSCIKPDIRPDHCTRDTDQPAAPLQDQRRQIEELTRTIEQLRQDKDYDQRRV